MTLPLNEQDYIQLGAYLDGALSASEKADFERRLKADARLQQELEALRSTVAILGLAEPLRAPRNFTLDPVIYARPAKASFWQIFSLKSTPALISSAAMAVVALAAAGAIVFTGLAPQSGADVAFVESQAEDEMLAMPADDTGAAAAEMVEETAVEEQPEAEMLSTGAPQPSPEPPDAAAASGMEEPEEATAESGEADMPEEGVVSSPPPGDSEAAPEDDAESADVGEVTRSTDDANQAELASVPPQEEDGSTDLDGETGSAQETAAQKSLPVRSVVLIGGLIIGGLSFAFFIIGLVLRVKGKSGS